MNIRKNVLTTDVACLFHHRRSLFINTSTLVICHCSTCHNSIYWNLRFFISIDRRV